MKYITTGSMTYSLALHGGALSLKKRYDFTDQEDFLSQVAEKSLKDLSEGISALDVAVEAISKIENSALYVAGKGSSPTDQGDYELDAGLAVNNEKQVASVSAICVQNPIIAARAVMEKSPHVFMTGEGAHLFLNRNGIRRIKDPGSYFCPSVHNAYLEQERAVKDSDTVGAVVLDQQGVMVAATSTAGISGKLKGRVGDTPVHGSGFLADDNVAVCCTGPGEYFIRTTAASSVSGFIQAGFCLEEAVEKTLDQISELGGDGGIMAMNRKGEVYFGIRGNNPAMHRAYINAKGSAEARTYFDE